MRRAFGGGTLRHDWKERSWLSARAIFLGALLGFLVGACTVVKWGPKDKWHFPRTGMEYWLATHMERVECPAVYPGVTVMSARVVRRGDHYEFDCLGDFADAIEKARVANGMSDVTGDLRGVVITFADQRDFPCGKYRGRYTACASPDGGVLVDWWTPHAGLVRGFAALKKARESGREEHADP